jgi:hypothetical protein
LTLDGTTLGIAIGWLDSEGLAEDEDFVDCCWKLHCQLLEIISGGCITNGYYLNQSN